MVAVDQQNIRKINPWRDRIAMVVVALLLSTLLIALDYRYRAGGTLWDSMETWALPLALWWIVGIGGGLVLHLLRSDRAVPNKARESLPRPLPSSFITVVNLLTLGCFGLFYRPWATRQIKLLTRRQDISVSADIWLSLFTLGLWGLWTDIRDVMICDATMSATSTRTYNPNAGLIISIVATTLCCGMFWLFGPGLVAAEHAKLYGIRSPVPIDVGVFE